MAALNIVASKAKPADFDAWTVIPGADGHEVLRIQTDDELDIDTVLVIDANDSMEEAWNDMAGDSAKLAYALMDKDSDGIDIYFAGVNSGEAGDEDSPAGGFLNVSNPLFLLEAFQKVKEAGFSKEEAVTDVVSTIFTKYLANYKPGNKRLNVILWTDGSFPQQPFEDCLVETANALKAAGAPLTQIGIQLFRVGNVTGVEEKFAYYDDNLATTKNLDRDLVDHRAYKPNLTQADITKVCLGAVDKNQDDA